MQCPKCGEEFSTYKSKVLNVVYCKSCKAVWLKFSELQELGRCMDLKIPLINPAQMEPLNVIEDTRFCPSCGKPMEKVYFNGIVADKCTDCDGILFDNGELVRYFNLFLKKPQKSIDNLAFIDTCCTENIEDKEKVMPEIEIQSREKEYSVASVNGFLMLFMMFIMALVIFTCFLYEFIALAIVLTVVFVVMMHGFKMLKPQEALVLTFFGKYIGTLKGAGFHYINPLATSVTVFAPVSLKARTLDNGKQKINDELGNPIEVGIIVIWEVQDTAKALFNVDDYTTFLASQSDSALRNIVRMYPYDAPEDSATESLRGDSQEISAKLKAEIQRNVKVAGLNIIDAKITHLAYAPEIAVAMLQRQQAVAIIDAKKTIVDGAVSMVEMALNRLSENNIVKLDEAEKARMVNNLLVTLCSNKEAQPVIKNG